MASYQSKHTGTEIDEGIDAAKDALPASGGAMTGALILHGNPTAPLGATPKQYVDDAISKIELTSGKDGVSPTITVTNISGGHRVTITDANGTQSFDVMDGTGGSSGGGASGADGYSPTISITSIEGGHRLHVTDVNGTQSFDVLDGDTPIRGIDYWTEEDKTEIKSYVDSAILGGVW